MRKKDDEANPYLRATPFDIGKPPRVPGGDVALRPVDDSGERRDAAMRWLERRRTTRGETLVAVTEEEDLNNALTVYVLDDAAKAKPPSPEAEAAAAQIATWAENSQWPAAYQEFLEETLKEPDGMVQIVTDLIGFHTDPANSHTCLLYTSDAADE